MYDDSLDRANSSEGTWTTNTRNIVITKDRKAVKNEDGFTIYAPNYTEGATPIGFITLYNDEVVIFSVTTTSEIGRISNKGVYSVIVRDAGFGFSIEHPISGRHHRNIYNNVEIVFTDNYNPVRVLNIDNLPFKLNPDYTLVDPLQLNNTLVFPNCRIPKITATKVRPDGGDITTGTIFFTGQYEDFSGYITNTFPIGNPVLIINMNSTYDKISGDPIGTKTPNSVELTITDIDTRFKKINLIVIRKEGSQYYSEMFTTINIHNETASAIYTGTEPHQSMSMSEVLVDRPSYTTASSVLIDSDVLYLADVGTKPKLNIQKYVNNWKVKYITDQVSLTSSASPEGAYKDGSTYHLKRTFMHNEVYALYAVVTMRDGNYQYAFHIPGRNARFIQGIPELAGYSENSSVSALKTIPNMGYLAEDEAISPQGDIKYFQTRDTSSPDGTMGFWENQNEYYPNDPNSDDWDIVAENGTVIGNLGGSKIRHHKTPTIGKHGYFDINNHYANIIGLQIYDMYLPTEIQDQIQNVEIFYAKRRGDNCTLAGRALLFFGAQGIVPENNNITSNAGNWSVTAGTSSTQIKTQSLDYKTIRVHAFDMLVDKTSVMPNYIYNNWKLHGDARIDAASSEDASIFAFTDFTNFKPTGGTVSITSPKEEYRVRGIYDQRYLPFNTIIGNIDGLNVSNRWNEEVFYAKFKADTQSRANQFMDLAFPQNTMSATNLSNNLIWSETYLTDLCLVKDDVYLRVDEQELVSTGYRVSFYPEPVTKVSITTDTIFGGDGYYGRQGNILTAPTWNTYKDTNQSDGIRHKIIFFVETANPPELQYGDFYPKYNYEMLNGGTFNETEYPIRFHKDYTTINSLNSVSHIDFEEQDLTRYYNRILRSGRIGRESKNLSWREFLPNDYYETVKDRGGIVHLEAINGDILIQHEYGLYITRSNEQLQTDISTVQVGSGDVFARPPKEIVDSKDGYVGCNSKFVCGKFKGGYFTADEKQGKIFIMDNSMKEISNEGMYKWFRDHLPMIGSLTTNNPFTFNGLCSSYDEVNNRIIFVKKQLLLPPNDLLNYKGHYTEDVEFIRSLKEGDVVYKDGKYMRVVEESPFVPIPPEEILPSE